MRAGIFNKTQEEINNKIEKLIPNSKTQKEKAKLIGFLIN